jgi:hypothetical protein
MTITEAIEKHRQRSETIGGWIFDAREIVRNRLPEDRDLFDLLQKIHYGHGGNTVEMDLTDSMIKWQRLDRAARAVETWWLEQGQHSFDGASAAIFALREALKP